MLISVDSWVIIDYFRVLWRAKIRSTVKLVTVWQKLLQVAAVNRDKSGGRRVEANICLVLNGANTCEEYAYDKQYTCRHFLDSSWV